MLHELTLLREASDLSPVIIRIRCESPKKKRRCEIVDVQKAYLTSAACHFISRIGKGFEMMNRELMPTCLEIIPTLVLRS